VIFAKRHLQELPKSERAILKEKYEYFIKLFNENLKYAQYSIMLFQKRLYRDEIELFEAYKVNEL